MCGIAGLVHTDAAPVSAVSLRRMTDAIAHRGPDGEGQWVEGNVGLGHRRLAIIDLSPAGHQPMVSVDHRFVLSYNGEVYNFRELRSELEALGYWFRSATDSEVVLNALAAWGVAALARLNGMFAFALWDRKERRLLLARDRYGIKPLYYFQQGATLAFASEQKAILAVPGMQRRLDKEALLEYFTFQNLFTDRTLLEGMRILPAGHYALLDPAGGTVRLELTRYWDFEFREPAGQVDAREWREELARLFHQAVNRQLIADVEVGSYLSGGIDSGAITAIAARCYPYLKSFTCGFDLSSASGIELSFDERVKAEAMSARFRTEHYEMVLKAGDMERVLPKLAWHLEEPRVGQSYPNYYAAQLAGKFVKVVMSGAGGDELFGGYPWRYYRAAGAQGFEEYIDLYYVFWQRLLDNRHLQKLFAPIWPEVKHVCTRDIFRDVFRNRDSRLERPEDYINHSLYFEAKTFLHGLLVVEDQLRPACGARGGEGEARRISRRLLGPGIGRGAASSRSGHSPLHLDSDALSLAPPPGFDQNRRAVLLSECAVVHRPHPAGIDRMVGTGAVPAADQRPIRPLSCGAWSRVPRADSLVRLHRLVFVAGSAFHLLLVRRQRRRHVADRRAGLHRAARADARR